MSNHLSRRNFLTGSAFFAAASTVGLGGLFDLSKVLAAGPDDMPTILNVSATGEAFSVAHYYRALDKSTKANFTPGQIAYLKAALEAEQAHLDVLIANGGKPLIAKFFFPAGSFDTVEAFATLTAIWETISVGVYVAATHSFAELGQPELAAMATQIAVVEGQHLALVNEIAGVFPNDLPLAAPVYYAVSDVVGSLGFLTQWMVDGSVGPLGAMEKTAVSSPGKDAVVQAIGKSALLAKLPAPFNTAIAPFAKQSVAAAATMAATVAK
ncbi:MAG TPA: ferritin-like domain-containing protein [Aggregatilineales bacterium]|nr:ferritin-like domain-containing protein [Aggregatilineales bacterium]